MQQLEVERAGKLREMERGRAVRSAKERAAEELEAASMSGQVYQEYGARLSLTAEKGGYTCACSM